MFRLLTSQFSASKGLWTLVLVVLSLGLLGCSSKKMTEPMQISSVKEMRTKNLIVQRHEYTCGAAALATVMNTISDTKYQERDILMSIKNTYVRTKGQYPALSVAHMVKAAKENNFKVVAFKSFKGNLSRQVVQKLSPLIVRLKLERNYAHFVVVRGFERGWVYISDPAFGNFRLTWKDFYEFWNKGDRVFLTVSKKQFIGWKGEDGSLHLKRDDSEKIPQPKAIAPYALYESNMRAVGLASSLDM